MFILIISEHKNIKLEKKKEDLNIDTYLPGDPEGPCDPVEP